MKALITGATSGIGLEIAALLSKNYDLYLVSRNKAKLNEVKSRFNATAIAIDISTTGAAQKVFNWCHKNPQKCLISLTFNLSEIKILTYLRPASQTVCLRG